MLIRAALGVAIGRPTVIAPRTEGRNTVSGAVGGRTGAHLAATPLPVVASVRDGRLYWVDRVDLRWRTADAMNSLPERIMEYAEARPEATPIQAKDLLHLGDPEAVARALSRLIRSDRLLRICRGVYMRHTQTRFGLRAPSLEQAIAAIASFWGETIVSSGGDAANWLGLTAQDTVCTVYLTSGPDPFLHFGAHQAKLLHAPRWQLAAANGTAGTVIRAISWLGPCEVERSLDAVLPKLSLGSRSHFTPDSRTLPADANRSESRRWR